MKKASLFLSAIITCMIGVSISQTAFSNTGCANINGIVTYKNNSVCALVLANGQQVFTSTVDGDFNLGVPLDDSGLDDKDEIVLFGFCSGFMPYKETIV